MRGHGKHQIMWVDRTLHYGLGGGLFFSFMFFFHPIYVFYFLLLLFFVPCFCFFFLLCFSFLLSLLFS